MFDFSGGCCCAFVLIMMFAIVVFIVDPDYLDLVYSFD